MTDIYENLNLRFEHTALKPETTTKDIEKLCQEALLWQFYGVVVNPVWVKECQTILRNTKIKIISVCGFPLGANRTDIKTMEAVKAVNDGANEIDIVANIGWLVADEFTKAEKEITEIRKSLPYNIILKVIIEANKLNKEQQINATRSVINGGAQFVKTGTGFFGGVTIEQVKTLYHAARGQIEIKAAGGIKEPKQARELIEAGASRLGCSSSIQIMEQLKIENNDKRP
ncbi:MAG: deoxyribose-phosphate aldolase [FCB group bacterium]|nr:deoxyribose-phosphate aldolase [FCB group bacterium]